jgi:uncharacterized protein
LAEESEMQQFGSPRLRRGKAWENRLVETLPDGDLTALALVQAIRTGDLAGLQRLLLEHPHLASARIQGAGTRTPLHIVTDWPGYFPTGPVIVRVLIDTGADRNGADANAPIADGPHDETPLHWRPAATMSMSPPH